MTIFLACVACYILGMVGGYTIWGARLRRVRAKLAEAREILTRDEMGCDP